MILAIFDRQITKMLLTKFQVNQPFSSGEEEKNRFSRWLPLWFKSNGLSFQEKKRKIDFQDGRHLGYLTGRILAIFDLQVPPVLPTKFQVNCPFGSGGETKNRFSRWISHRNGFSCFFISKSSWCFLPNIKLIGPGV